MMRRCLDAGLIMLLLTVLGGAAWWLSRDGDADSAATAVETGSSSGFAIRDVRVFDGERVLARANVLVRDGRIAAVGSTVAIPDGIAVIDGEGRTLLPGLIDAHTHSYGDARRDALRFGVTTEIDMMGDAGRLPQLASQRTSLDATEQADLFSAGFAVTVPGGHGTEYGLAVPTLGADGDVAPFVAARVAEGSDVIKLMVDDLHAYGSQTRWPTLSRQQVEAGIAAAHAHGKLALVHVAALDDARHAVAAGADGLAHAVVDAAMGAQDAALLHERGAFVIPTLSVLASEQRAGEAAALLADARLRARLTAPQVGVLEAEFPAGVMPPLPALDRGLASVRVLHAAGVDVLAGTDAGNPGTAHGASLHGELALLVRAGLSPIAALRAATALPAVRFGLAGRGRIEAGARADLLLVDGDPTLRITDTRRIVAVWKNGAQLLTDTATKLAAQPGMALPEDEVLLGDFEADASTAPIGSGWQAATDRFMGGRSKADIEHLMPGADGSRGALRIHGRIVASASGGPAWAGAMRFLDAESRAVDLSARRAIVLQARGKGGDCGLVLLPADGGQPLQIAFDLPRDWQRIEIALDAFAQPALRRIAGLTIACSRPGPLQLDLDDIRIR